MLLNGLTPFTPSSTHWVTQFPFLHQAAPNILHRFSTEDKLLQKGQGMHIDAYRRLALNLNLITPGEAGVI